LTGVGVIHTNIVMGDGKECMAAQMVFESV